MPSAPSQFSSSPWSSGGSAAAASQLPPASAAWPASVVFPSTLGEGAPSTVHSGVAASGVPAGPPPSTLHAQSHAIVEQLTKRERGRMVILQGKKEGNAPGGRSNAPALVLRN